MPPSQNPNESINNIIWNRLPKIVFVSLNTLKFGVAEAVASFNNGNIVKCNVLHEMGIRPGKYCVDTMMQLDKQRIYQADGAFNELQKKALQRHQNAKRKLEQQLQEEESEAEPSYASGRY